MLACWCRSLCYVSRTTFRCLVFLLLIAIVDWMLGLAISLAGTAEQGYLKAIAVSMWPFQVGRPDRVYRPVHSRLSVSRS